MSNYFVTIGIEIHCELKTKTKMFSSAPTSFGEVANTCVNEIDLGHPGTLPCVNKHAIELAIKACTGMHCAIDPLVRFDRKNYYYSDLPKGYQITQQFFPIGKDGYVEIDVDGEKKKIGIERIHMEEDTAKQFHKETGTYIDFNRAGTPLIEIVSRPDMHSAKEAAAYVETLRKNLFYLNVSDVKMEEGSMRCDVNISLSADENTLGTKVEIKNLNSIANVQKAVQAEIERQSALLDSGEEVEQATRRFDEAQKTTILMRKKEGNVDYKYFPEPNIFPIQLDAAWIQNIQDHLEELPDARIERFMRDYGLNDYDAGVLVADRAMADYFEAVAKQTKETKKAANWIIGDMSAWLNKNAKNFETIEVEPQALATLIDLISKGEISGKQGKVVFEEVMLGKDPKQVVEEKGMKQVSDDGAILALVNSVLDANPQSIEDYKNGKDRAIGFLVGQVMKASKGQANPKRTNELIREELAKR
ncbi:Asp-tRNA(Asn)/Glu-tRNA(Gln) amidotransferase subunit GatB [Dubosiella muris]|uniref:Asp-tRNA(Asn)/Glu-tRNA(Gln) amidotransferase subunit GatB n=1 Tax=Dubosiella muris TaxID=3038133 RepID=A0AC61R8U0_9FIRM|nr:Asp-tRNA(Asn)/Glu-tRNA(Gln) amidotransferase subunit GatB [Dubosiella muris]TGY66731.1 Asp-tRNA(Asn)/Glu-tRNA(Gln) amidotransferase subunit GatB [Dubosiella muris]